MNQLTTKFDAAPGERKGTRLSAGASFVDSFARIWSGSGFSRKTSITI
jgi:hypothetical protein